MSSLDEIEIAENEPKIVEEPILTLVFWDDNSATKTITINFNASFLQRYTKSSPLIAQMFSPIFAQSNGFDLSQYKVTYPIFLKMLKYWDKHVQPTYDDCQEMLEINGAVKVFGVDELIDKYTYHVDELYKLNKRDADIRNSEIEVRKYLNTTDEKSLSSTNYLINNLLAYKTTNTLENITTKPVQTQFGHLSGELDFHADRYQPRKADRFIYIYSDLKKAISSGTSRIPMLNQYFSVNPPIDVDGYYTIGVVQPMKISTDNFAERFNVATDNLFKGFDFANLVVAGGAINSILLGQSIKDIDLYLITKDPQEAIQAITKLYNHFANKFLKERYQTHIAGSNFQLGKQENPTTEQLQEEFEQLKRGSIKMIRTQFSITFFIQDFQPIQVILRLYNSIVQCISGFDIDSCCVAWDGSNLYAMPRYVRAVTTGYNLTDPLRQSKNYAERLVKYFRRGFAIALPGYVPERIDLDAVLRQKDTKGLARVLHVYFKFATSLKREPNESTRSDYDPMVAVSADYFEADIARKILKLIYRDRYANKAEEKLDSESLIADIQMYNTKLNFIFSGDLNIIFNYNPSASKLIQFSDAYELFDTYPFDITIPKQIQFIQDNPGTQVSGSFQPVYDEWYKSLYCKDD